MKKLKVKFLTSIAGLADPDRAALDQKYTRLFEQAQQRFLAANPNREFRPDSVKQMIAEHKKSDRYDDVQRGFARDFGYKTGDEAMIPVEMAEKWASDGICAILEDLKKAA